MKRQIVLDTETTGIDPRAGHRLIEIGCVELIDRKPTGSNLHLYFNPARKVPMEATKIHGITNKFLADKPYFYESVAEIMEYLIGAELIIHNAAFDLGFLNHELSSLIENKWGTIEQRCGVLDTLAFARTKHPGQRNSLDALCKRYNISNEHRTFHGALLDAELLSSVYLAMTGGQMLLFDTDESENKSNTNSSLTGNKIKINLDEVPVIKASKTELAEHDKYLAKLSKQANSKIKW